MAVLKGAQVHVVVGPSERADRIRDALERAGISSETVAPGAIARLEPAGQCGLEGWSAHLAGGERRFAGAVLASAPSELEWLDPALLDWDAGRPALVAGLLCPGLANLYVFGLGTACFREGGVELLLAMIEAQAQLSHPLVDELVRIAPPSHRLPEGRAGRRMERRVQRRLPPVGSGSWWGAAKDVDGPLAHARGA